jgi:hypothetical protein
MSLVRLSDELHRSASMYPSPNFFKPSLSGLNLTWPSHVCTLVTCKCPCHSLSLFNVMYLLFVKCRPCSLSSGNVLPILPEASLRGYMGTTRFLVCPVIFCKADSPEIALALLTSGRYHGLGKHVQSAHLTCSTN